MFGLVINQLCRIQQQLRSCYYEFCPFLTNALKEREVQFLDNHVPIALQSINVTEAALVLG